MDSDPNRNVGRTVGHRSVRRVGLRPNAPGNRSDARFDPSWCRTALRHGHEVTSTGMSWCKHTLFRK